MENKKGRKIAGYVRVSSLDQKKEGYSIDAQKSLITKYCENNNHTLVKIYEDAGISGGTIIKRPAFKLLLSDARLHKFDAIVVLKLDRAFRNIKDAIFTSEELEKIKIDFISLNENIDTTSAMGRFFFNLMSALAQFERELTSERMDISFIQKFNEGRNIGRCPFGYKWDKKKKIMYLDLKNSEIVKEIFSLTINKISYKDICLKFNLKPQSYYNIIRNPVYCGFVSFEGKTRPGIHPKIISLEQFKLINPNFL